MRKTCKRCLPFFLLILFLVLCPGSSVTATEINYGLKGGLSLGKVNTRPEYLVEGFPWKTKTGLVGGAFLSLEVGKGLAIQPEVLFVQKGVRLLDEEYDFEARFSFDYFEIPILLKIDLNLPDSVVVPSIFFGPFFGFNNQAKVTLKEASLEETEDIKADLEKSEYGLTFGLLLTQRWGPGKFLVDIRYDLGLANILIPESGWTDTMKTRTWLFMIGYSF